MPALAPSPTLVTAAELAELLGVTADALHAQCRRGQRPGSLALQIGKRRYWDLGEVLDDARRRRETGERR